MVGAHSSRVSNAVIVGLVALLMFICLVPMLNVIAVSFSDNSAIVAGKVTIWPVQPTLLAYRGVITDKTMVRTLLFTILLTVVYTVIAMTLTVLAAYSLSKKRLKGRNIFMTIIILTMFFNPGLIPTYLWIKSLGIMDTFWCLALPGVMSAYNLILVKTCFMDLPVSFEESAIMDGANHLQILGKIVLPLSTAVIATISLYYAVGRWNGFQDALYYVTKRELYPIQMKLYQIIMQNQSLQVSSLEGTFGTAVLPESLRAACVVFATVPILMAYPWLQNYFVKGVMIGGIKE
jgi:putative aldouronate transport system permease protein